MAEKIGRAYDADSRLQEARCVGEAKDGNGVLTFDEPGPQCDRFCLALRFVQLRLDAWP